MREKPIPANILRKVNDTIQKRIKQTREHNNQNIIYENQILSEYCLAPDLEPTDIARIMNRKQNTDEYTGRRLIETLKSIKLTNISERTQVLQKGTEVGDIILRCLYGEPAAFEAYNKQKKAFHDNHSSMARIALMSLFQKSRQLRELECFEEVFCLGQVYSKYCLLELMDSIRFEYAKTSDGLKSIETAEQKLEEKLRLTEGQLRSTNEMLEELQGEFEDRMQESKTEELTVFFAQLNSEKYGFILDSLFSARAGLDELKKLNITVPVQINGLTILIRKLIQFVRDAGVSPILQIGAIMTVASGDIENYIYEGSPFANEKDKKQVEVVSPGWMLKDKGILFSAPQIREVQK